MTLICVGFPGIFGERFSETVAMRTAILENVDLCIDFALFNSCTERNDYSAWFKWFLKFMDHQREIKHLAYIDMRPDSFGRSWSVGDGNEFANALKLTNNDGHIKSFALAANFNTIEAFQPTWNALLDTGVEDLDLAVDILDHNDDASIHYVDFTRLSTNTTLKNLEVNVFLNSSNEFFETMKMNKGIEKLMISFGGTLLHKQEMVARFKKMLCANSTLINVQAIIANGDINYNHLQQNIDNVITIETKFNRLWKQYLKKRKEEEERNASAITTPPPPLPAHLAAAVERKRSFTLGCLIAAFEEKTVMRDTVLFHFLSETPDLLIDNDVQQNRVFCTRKRPRRKCGHYK